ncbi:947_t:CDS:1 [Acaulospora colombiana]|uniref:947_t:CDS:1 n=1 Tax=Acaulospora colombiana TaxID=27376 RepID=A0ACA9K7W2_9GLOM|nr:947_t:CDS:1 [Acaulospora colombiana]
MALQTPPILGSSYNNGGAGGAITPPPDPANNRSSGVKQISPQQTPPRQPTLPQQHPRIAPAPAPTFVNVANLAGVPLNMNLAQCCPVTLQQQQQFIINDNSNGIGNPKLVPQPQSKNLNHHPCVTNSSHPATTATSNNTAAASNLTSRPLMQPTTSERPESIVFLFQIPNDAKIYLVKCVEVSQILDIDVRGHSAKQPQQNIRHHLEQHLTQRFQPSHQPHPHPPTHLQSQQQQQFSQPQQNPYQLQQILQLHAQQQQLRHHPYQQRLSPKSSLHIGKNIKTSGSSIACNDNGTSASLQNLAESGNGNENNNNIIDQTADLQQLSVEMNQNTGNFDIMLPMTAGTAPGAYMVTPSATPTMRNDQLIPDFNVATNYLVQQQMLANAQPQNMFNGFDKNGEAN